MTIQIQTITSEMIVSQGGGTKVKGSRAETGFYGDVGRSAIVYKDTLTSFLPGTAMKIHSSTTSTLLIVEEATVTDIICGVVIRKNDKNNKYESGTGTALMISGDIYMEAGAAISAGTYVEWQPTGGKVITALGINSVVGIALEPAMISGDIIKIQLELNKKI